MRKYQPIWEQLKTSSTVTIVAPIESHTTITNMVKKEKRQDYAFKLACSEKHIAYRLYIRSNVKEGTLTFTLKRSYLSTIGNL